jgi:DNA-binding MarR family transcriptional regulator
MDFTRADRADGPAPVPLHALTTRQRGVLEAIERYEDATGEPCSAHYLARRFSINPSTIRDHLFALYRKGWLRTPHSPASLRRR